MENSALPMLFFTFGLMFFIVSIFEYFFPSKSRSQKGYRTKRSLYTHESWDFAQKYYAKMMFIVIDCIVFFISIYSNFRHNRSNNIRSHSNRLMLFHHFKTENALKEKF